MAHGSFQFKIDNAQASRRKSDKAGESGDGRQVEPHLIPFVDSPVTLPATSTKK